MYKHLLLNSAGFSSHNAARSIDWFTNVSNMRSGKNPGFNYNVKTESSGNLCMQSKLNTKAFSCSFYIYMYLADTLIQSNLRIIKTGYNRVVYSHQDTTCLITKLTLPHFFLK